LWDLPAARKLELRRTSVLRKLGQADCLASPAAIRQLSSTKLRDLGEYYLEYHRLMDHWRAVLPGQVLDLQYEDLVTDFDAQLPRLLDYCGLSWDEQCLRFHESRRAVRSASSEQVRQPLNRAGLHRWRDYERHLQPLIDILAPVLGELPPPWRPACMRLK